MSKAKDDSCVNCNKTGPYAGICPKKANDGIRQIFRNIDCLECVVCIQGKHSHDSFSCSESRIKNKLELVHMDLCGTFEVPAIEECRDDATEKVLETKYQALDAYEKFKTTAERQKIGCEYVNSRFKQSMIRDGWRHQKTCPYTPECINCTILDKVRSMLKYAYLLKRF